MVARLIAGAVLIAGLAVIAWVALGGADPESTGDTAALPTSNDGEPIGAGGESASVDPVAPTATPFFPEPENLGRRMDLVGIDGWLQTDATSIDDFDGMVLMVEMWTFGCHNCKARIPFNQSYYQEFGDENFEILGVHAPEFGYEADRANIVEALDRLDVTWPQALDTDLVNFRAWQPGRTNYWPRTYVIDQNGDIRYDHIGEGGYEELRATIRHLLEHPPAPQT